MSARRRRWQATLIITLFFMAVAGAAAIGWWYARESPPHQGPIVLISVDGMPASALPVSDGSGANGGALADLAADGIVFDRAYTHATELLPATASLLSGQLPFDHHVRGDAGFTVASDTRTLAELLRGRGFSTGAAISSVLLRRETGVAQGFTFFDDGILHTPESGPPPIARDGAETLDVAERWARAQGGQRYFLFVEVAQPDADLAVSRLVQLLKDKRLYDKATIVFMSTRGTTEPAPLLDEATLRVPLIVKQPSREGAGRHVASPVQQADILPTLLDLVRAPIPGGIRGRSLRRVLDSNAVLPPQPIYSESLSAYFRFGGQPLYAVTGTRTRFVWGFDDRAVPIAGTDDPVDVSAPVPDEEAALRAAMDRFVGTRAIDVPDPVAPAIADSLASAGYLAGLAPAPASDAALDQDRQRAIVKAHHDAALTIGSGRLPEGLRILQDIVTQQPALPMVHYQIGVLLGRLGRVNDAATSFERARSYRPDAVEIRLAEGRMFLDADRPDDAQSSADAVIAAAPNDARVVAAAHAIAARVALARHDPDGAMTEAGAAQDADPALPARSFIRGRVLYDDAMYEEARAAFDEAAAVLREHASTMPGVHFYLGESLAHLDRYTEAEAAFRQELHDYPHDIAPYSSLALLYRASDREDDMVAVLKRLIETVPTPAGYAAAARLWTIAGDRPRAEAIRSDARVRFQAGPAVAKTPRDGRR